MLAKAAVVKSENRYSRDTPGLGQATMNSVEQTDRRLA